MNRFWCYDAGRMPYGTAWELQHEVGARVRAGLIPDTLIMVEHPPVYTVGRGARGSLDNLLWDDAKRASEGIELYQVDRGGDITYHGPGQLVGYPILDLHHYDRDIHGYLRKIEETLIRTVAALGVVAGRLPPHTGVWVGDEKLVAIGVKASHWITQHGFALNVEPNLSHFTGIIPCGIEDKGVTSLAKLLGRHVSLSEVRPHLEKAFSDIFQATLQQVDEEELLESAIQA